MKRDSWFDRTYKAGSRKPPAKVPVPDASGAIYCNGKCRRGRLDSKCPLHGVWRLT